MIDALYEGLQIHSWTILKKTDRNKANRQMWLCRCVCGKEKEVIQNNLVTGVSKSCGCRGRIKLIARNKSRINKATSNSVLNQIIAGYKKDAKDRGYSWHLTNDQCYKLFESRCHYCGSEATNERKYHKDKSITAKYMGIDRIDNTKWYTIDNVVPCCKKCNRAKDTMTYDEFIKHIESIYKHLVKKVNNEI